MKCLALPALLAIAFSLPAQAFNWPWQSQADTNYGFCNGFVKAGLQEDQIASSSRTDLWLTWNYINRSSMPEGGVLETDFQQGVDRLNTLVANNDFEGIREIKESQCYLGRNNHSSDDEFSKS